MHPSAVPPAMIERATERRLAGDWRGACEAAYVTVEIDDPRRDPEAAAALRHVIPDLLRWHLPRAPGTGLFEERVYALAPVGAARVLTARTPPAHHPQRVSLTVGEARPAYDLRFFGLPDRWDARHTGELLTRCGGPGFPASRPLLLDEAGRHAEAWAAAGFDLRVLLFDERWGRARTDPGAWTDPARRARAVDQSLAWLRPAFAHLPALVRRAVGAAGLVRVDLRGRRLVLEAGGPRVWLLNAADPPGTPIAPVAPPALSFGAPGLSSGAPGLSFAAPGAASGSSALFAGPPGGSSFAAAGAPGVPSARAASALAAEREEFGVELHRLPSLPPALIRRPWELTALLRGALSPDQLHPVAFATLFPGLPGPHPPPSCPVPAGVRIRCGTATHTVELRDGRLFVPHTATEIRRERALVALGGERIGCLAALDGWHDPDARMPRPMRRLRDQLMLLAQHGDVWALRAAAEQGLDHRVRDERGLSLDDRLAWTGATL